MRSRAFFCSHQIQKRTTHGLVHHPGRRPFVPGGVSAHHMTVPCTRAFRTDDVVGFWSGGTMRDECTYSVASVVRMLCDRYYVHYIRGSLSWVASGIVGFPGASSETYAPV